MRRLLLLAVLALAAAPQASGRALAREAGPPVDMTVSAMRGETIARSRCSSCHAVALNDTSPNPNSPPLRTIGARYPVDNLEEAFAEGIMVSHDQAMPAFVLSPEETADLLAYLKELHRQDESREVSW